MTEKQKRFLEEYKRYATAEDSGQFVDQFAQAVVERAEEICRTALYANNPTTRLENTLMAAAFKILADSMYNALSATGQSVCDTFTELCEPTLYFVQEEDKEGGQK